MYRSLEPGQTEHLPSTFCSVVEREGRSRAVVVLVKRALTYDAMNCCTSAL
jgi:hypothetical protein